METDDDGLANYRVGCRLLGEMIKRFFSPKCQQRLSNFLSMANVMLDEFMVGWSEKDVPSEIKNIQQSKSQIFDHETFKNIAAGLISQQSGGQQNDKENAIHVDPAKKQLVANLISGNYDRNSIDYEKLYDQYVRFRVKRCVTGFENI